LEVGDPILSSCMRLDSLAGPDFTLEFRARGPHAGRMKLFAIFTLAFCLGAVSQSRAGETNSPAVILGTAQVATNIGKQVTVTGVVAQVSVRPGLTFLNFDKGYPDSPFTAIVRSKNTNAFDNLKALKGKPVAVQGKVIEFNGKPEIELTNQAQLKVLGETK
jgi:DNA/RNA endonuclease YhcR with UshA esterase domain